MTYQILMFYSSFIYRKRLIPYQGSQYQVLQGIFSIQEGDYNHKESVTVCVKKIQTDLKKAGTDEHISTIY